MERHALENMHSISPTSSRVNVRYIGGYYRIFFPKAHRDRTGTMASVTYRPTDIKPLQMHVKAEWK